MKSGLFETTSYCSESSYETLNSTESLYETASLSSQSTNETSEFEVASRSSEELSDEKSNHNADEPIEGSVASYYPTISCLPRSSMVSIISFDDFDISLRSQKDASKEFQAIKLRLNGSSFFSKEDTIESVVDDAAEKEMHVPDVAKTRRRTSFTRLRREVSRKSMQTRVAPFDEPIQPPSNVLSDTTVKPQKPKGSPSTGKRKKRSSKEAVESKIEPMDGSISNNRPKPLNMRNSTPTSVSCNFAGQLIENYGDTTLLPSSTSLRQSEQKSNTAVVTQKKASRSKSKRSRMKSTKKAGTPKARKSVSKEPSGGMRRRLWTLMAKFQPPQSSRVVNEQ